MQPTDIVVDGVKLSAQRTANGYIINGIPLDMSSKETALTTEQLRVLTWLQRQSALSLKHITLQWQDSQQQTQLSAQLSRFWNRHTLLLRLHGQHTGTMDLKMTIIGDLRKIREAKVAVHAQLQQINLKQWYLHF